MCEIILRIFVQISMNVQLTTVGAQKSAKTRMGVSSAPVTVTKKLYRRMASLAWVSFSSSNKYSIILG